MADRTALDDYKECIRDWALSERTPAMVAASVTFEQMSEPKGDSITPEVQDGFVFGDPRGAERHVEYEDPGMPGYVRVVERDDDGDVISLMMGPVEDEPLPGMRALVRESALRISEAATAHQGFPVPAVVGSFVFAADVPAATFDGPSGIVGIKLK